jgi:hypothetical protein
MVPLDGSIFFAVLFRYGSKRNTDGRVCPAIRGELPAVLWKEEIKLVHR